MTLAASRETLLCMLGNFPAFVVFKINSFFSKKGKGKNLQYSFSEIGSVRKQVQIQFNIIEIGTRHCHTKKILAKHYHRFAYLYLDNVITY